jgi:hypothetical protein
MKWVTDSMKYLMILLPVDSMICEKVRSVYNKCLIFEKVSWQVEKLKDFEISEYMTHFNMYLLDV